MHKIVHGASKQLVTVYCTSETILPTSPDKTLPQRYPFGRHYTADCIIHNSITSTLKLTFFIHLLPKLHVIAVFAILQTLRITSHPPVHVFFVTFLLFGVETSTQQYSHPLTLYTQKVFHPSWNLFKNEHRHIITTRTRHQTFKSLLYICKTFSKHTLNMFKRFDCLNASNMTSGIQSPYLVKHESK